MSTDQLAVQVQITNCRLDVTRTISEPSLGPTCDAIGTREKAPSVLDCTEYLMFAP